MDFSSKNGKEFLDSLVTKYCPEPSVSPKIRLQQYLDRAHDLYQSSIECVKQKKNVKAYVELMRFSQLAIKLAEHPSYKDKKFTNERNLYKKRINNAIIKLEELKPQLIQSYEESLAKHNQKLEEEASQAAQTPQVPQQPQQPQTPPAHATNTDNTNDTDPNNSNSSQADATSPASPAGATSPVSPATPGSAGSAGSPGTDANVEQSYQSYPALPKQESVLAKQMERKKQSLYAIDASVGSVGSVGGTETEDKDDEEKSGHVNGNGNNDKTFYPVLDKESGQRRYEITEQCPICLEGPRILVINKQCHHGGCHACMIQYLRANYLDITKYPIKCFQFGCDQVLNYHTIVRKVLNEQQLRKFDNLASRAAVQQNDLNFITCDECSFIMEIPETNLRIKINCMNPKCGIALCVRCHCKWHENMTCEDYQREIELKFENPRNEKDFETLKEKEQLSECPKCGIVIEKVAGCNHMTHRKCVKADTVYNDEKRTDFCYLCRKVLIHKDDGGWRYDIDGKLHFPDGVFQKCIYSKDAKEEKQD